jgi:hypothetical protein
MTCFDYGEASRHFPPHEMHRGNVDKGRPAGFGRWALTRPRGPSANELGARDRRGIATVKTTLTAILILM